MFKSDQEPAILALKRDVAAGLKAVEFLPEESPVGEHACNGHVESAIRRIAAQIRCLKDVVEHRYKTKLSIRHPLMAWMVSHAAHLIGRFSVGKDGRTPFELARGKPYRRKLIPFGETCHFMAVKGSGSRLNKLDTKWEKGIFAGILPRSDEVLMLTSDGLRKARAIRRLPASERHDRELLLKVKGIPWDKAGSGEKDDTDAAADILPAGICAPVINDVPIVETNRQEAPIQPRRTYIRAKHELKDYGYTPGCSACEDTAAGKRKGGTLHSEECRARINKRIEEDQDKAVQERAKEKRRKEDKKIAEMMEKADKAEPQGASDDAPMAASATPDGVDADPPTGSGKRQKTEESVAQAASDAPGGATQMSVDDVSASATATQRKGKRENPVSVEDSDPREHKSIAIESLELRRAIQEAYAGQDVSSLECMEMAREIKAINGVDISEVYSPPRFTAQAPFEGLKPGTAFDLETGWDLKESKQFREMRAVAAEEKPFLMTGSPPCTAFCQLQKGLNFPKMDPEKVRRIIEEGELHLDRAITMYHDQINRGGFMLHEHPWGASSWKHPRMRELMEQEGMYLVKGPQCTWDMMSQDHEGPGLVRKETGWLTNSPELAAALSSTCTNVTGTRPWHRHVRLMGGRAKAAAAYPPKLVRAVLLALRRQMQACGEIGRLEIGGPSPHEPLIEPQVPEVAQEIGGYWDDVKGGWLEPTLVQKARAEEVAQVIRYAVIALVARQRMVESGKKAIDTVWVDTNKGTSQKPNYRSRMCARELKARQKLGIDQPAGNASDLFASMPPLEAIRLVFSLYASRSLSRNGKPLKVGLYDISRAYFNATASREDLFIEVPDELLPAGTSRDDVIGILQKSMYGTRDAGANWEKEFTDCMATGKFEQGKACPNIYWHEEKDILLVCHGDDAHALGDDDAQEYVQKIMKERYEVKTRAILGTGPSDDREGTFLNRIVRICDDGSVEIEADPRHAQEIIKEMGVGSGKGVATPIIKEPAAIAETELPPLDKDATKRFRSVCMRACYLSFDRYDIQYAVKEAAREMHLPTQRGEQRLKRLARYLITQPRVIIRYERQNLPTKVTGYTDSDHAGCKRTRKSTSGLCILFGKHTIRTAAATQSTIGLSSPESEYYALVKGASACLGIQALLEDCGYKAGVHVWCDASSGISLAHRRGLGKTRHVSTRYLWVQQRVNNKDIVVQKVPRAENPADTGTGCRTEKEIEATFEMLHMKPGLLME